MYLRRALTRAMAFSSRSHGRRFLRLVPLREFAVVDLARGFTAVNLRDVVVAGMRILGLHRCRQSDYVETVSQLSKAAASNQRRFAARNLWRSRSVWRRDLMPVASRAVRSNAVRRASQRRGESRTAGQLAARGLVTARARQKRLNRRKAPVLVLVAGLGFCKPDIPRLDAKRPDRLRPQYRVRVHRPAGRQSHDQRSPDTPRDAKSASSATADRECCRKASMRRVSSCCDL